MLKTTVTCWFCNKESTVFLLNKNSWTCKHCDQYNGFKKDGDYNKKIPEMESDGEEAAKKHYCTTSTAAPLPNTNLLCDKCNRNQELKLADLNKFEPKNEDNFEEEYRIYKLKMDQIYGLCQPCSMKLNSHLKKQDLQIGDYLVKNRRSSVLPNGNGVGSAGSKLLPNGHKHAASNGKNGGANIVVMSAQTATTTTITAGSMLNGSSAPNKADLRHRPSLQPPKPQAIKNAAAKLSDSLVSLDNSINTSYSTSGVGGGKSKYEELNGSGGGSNKVSSPSQQFFQKAYTIAGTVPSMMIKQTKQALNNISINATQGASFLDENYFEFEEVDAGGKAASPHSYANNGKHNHQHATPARPERKIKVTFSSIMTIFVDLVILALVNLMFACDIINLVNDSGVLMIANPLGESDYPYFQTLLSIYKYKLWIFALMVILSARVAFKRPRVSRFVTVVCFVFGLLVHADMFGTQAEEQFIVECMVSFFLAGYLLMARAYNLVQCVRSF